MNLVEWIAYWRFNPCSFVKEYFGFQLYWFQKLYLQILWNWRLHAIYDILFERKSIARQLALLSRVKPNAAELTEADQSLPY
mgnify:CR=1 FL=1